MSISMNDSQMSSQQQSQSRGSFADGLTLFRLFLTPIIMAIILFGWPSNDMALLATTLLLLAALSDFLDDLLGGAATSRYRRWGWFDDIADTVLIIGILIAMAWVIRGQDMMGWAFAIPAGIIILREFLVGFTGAVIRGYSLRQYGWPETRYGTLKNSLYIIATCLLLASPWLTNWLDSLRARPDTILQIYGSASAYVWLAGQTLLWIAAILSVLTGAQLIIAKTSSSPHSTDS